MARVSPLRKLHQQAEAAVALYGPGDDATTKVEVVETYGELELEYAAIRKSVMLMDQPHRGMIEVTGRDRLEFLNRMVTQELKGLPPFRVRRSFWLNRKGRIDADLRIIDLPDRTILEMDTFSVPRALEGLTSFVVMEDVKLIDATEKYHRIALHGTTGTLLVRPLAQFAGGALASGPAFDELRPDYACVIKLADAECIVFRDDATGDCGLEFVVPTDAAASLYEQFIELGAEHDHGGGKSSSLSAKVRLRPGGWHAFNIARIEAGTPLYNLDFGPDSLPAETGVLDDRVSFKKGCYLGQEVVARMHARGAVKQRLVAILFEGHRDANGYTFQPITGTPVHIAPAEGGDAVGAITSSAVSPMRGAQPACFAMLKHEHAVPGLEVYARADGQTIKGRVQEGLRFWSRGDWMNV